MRLLLLLVVVLLSACSAPMPREQEATIGKTYQETDTGAGEELASYARSLLGVPYHFGGNDPDEGFDCSGYVSYVYAHSAGISLPHNSAQISRYGRFVYRSDLRVGDLVFFNTSRQKYSHVGIYTGEGTFIHAPSSGGSIRIDELSNPYWERNYNGARRLIE